MFPVQAAKYRHSLSHVIGVTVSEYYEMIRLPAILRTISFSLIHPTSIPGDNRVSQVPDTSLTACHALGLRQTLGNLATLRFLCIGFRCVKIVAICIDSINEAVLLRGSTFPLRPTVFPVYASGGSFACSHIPVKTGVRIAILHTRNTRYE